MLYTMTDHRLLTNYLSAGQGRRASKIRSWIPAARTPPVIINDTNRVCSFTSGDRNRMNEPTNG